MTSLRLGDNSSFPSYVEILEYLHKYATHFDVSKFVKFNSKVGEIHYLGDGDHTTHNTRVWEAPMWPSCLGGCRTLLSLWWFLLASTPTYPKNKGPEIFNGKLDRKGAHELLKGNKVAVVGYKKSAMECAIHRLMLDLLKGAKGQPCTMVIGTLHWTIPSYWIWGLPFFLFYSTRSSQFLYQRPNPNLFGAFLCLSLSPLRKEISKFIESYLVWKLPLEKDGLKPDRPFVEDYASCQIISSIRQTKE
ncbi:hypothetical protein L6164_015656 [Bauhinia variegata]|uniref:Uncharacterized protein n=1 Tax=Bauhinia variegata TaxID=167791 RepID=A0ACB9NMK1_BAUVA|nr:hypothetical protein L6164_015656 [Bauhinia variegata]